ncbi:Putative disease resistance protein RGA3 [Linum perenne]
MAFSLFSIGNTVLEKLGPLAQQEALLLWNLPTELEKLSSTVTAIQALLLDAEEKQDHNHQVKNWVEKLSVLLFDAEDLLDDVTTETLRWEAAVGGQNSNCRTGVCFLLSLPSRLIYGLVIAHKVKSLRLKLDSLHHDKTKLNLITRSEEKLKMRKHTPTISSIPNIVIGREDDLNKIKNLLLFADNVSSSSNAIPVISACGVL